MLVSRTVEYKKKPILKYPGKPHTFAPMRIRVLMELGIENLYFMTKKALINSEIPPYILDSNRVTFQEEPKDKFV